MLFTANCIDTPYTSAPGSTAISESISNSRVFSREPNTPPRTSRRRRANWRPTSTSKATAATPLIASSQG